MMAIREFWARTMLYFFHTDTRPPSIRWGG